jgi:hypothetical protein
MEKQKCKPGFRWCPIQKKCIPEDKMKGKGQGQTRGQGQGPMGKPKGVNEMDKIKVATELVDIILTGDYEEYKIVQDSMTLADQLIDEIENKIDTVPDQDIETLYKTVSDELSTDKEEETPEPTSVEEAMVESVRRLIKEEDYREFFKGMLSKWNIKSPTELSDDKKKEFFDQVDKGWKGKKETD